MKNVCVLGCGRLGQIIADGLHTGKVKGCRLEGVMVMKRLLRKQPANFSAGLVQI